MNSIQSRRSFAVHKTKLCTYLVLCFFFSEVASGSEGLRIAKFLGQADESDRLLPVVTPSVPSPLFTKKAIQHELGEILLLWHIKKCVGLASRRRIYIE